MQRRTFKTPRHAAIIISATRQVKKKGTRSQSRDDKDEKLNFDLGYDKIYTLITELDSASYNFYVDGEFTEVFPKNRNSAIMMTALVEEMHRLHVNYYKNFPWFDYMYKN